MVAKSPSISKVLKRGRDNLHSLQSNSKFEPLASEEDSLDGLNPHGIIADEVHAWKIGCFGMFCLTAMGRAPDASLCCWVLAPPGADRKSCLISSMITASRF